MKVLYVQDNDWIRRNPDQHIHLTERLVLKGHEVRAIDYETRWRTEGKKELISKRQVFQIARLFKDAYVQVIRPGILKIPILDYASLLFTYSGEINRQIREFKPDVIIGDSILTTYLGYRAARKHNILTVYYTLDVSHKFIPFKFLQSLGKIIESKNIRDADLVLAINRGLREYTIGIGANPDKSIVITAGTDIKRFDRGIDGAETRQRYGIAEGDLLLFFVGWIHHFNGLKEVAIELAKLESNNIKLLIVGDGDGYEELEKTRERYNLQDKLILTGRKPYDEIPPFLAAADICLLPSDPSEPIVQNIVPIKMYDYLAMGKPIISTRLPGIMKEFGEDNGIVYIDRPEDTVAKAIELVQNGTIEELGRKARSFAEKHSWDRITNEFEKVLEELIREKHNR